MRALIEVQLVSPLSPLASVQLTTKSPFARLVTSGSNWSPEVVPLTRISAPTAAPLSENTWVLIGRAGTVPGRRISIRPGDGESAVAQGGDLAIVVPRRKGRYDDVPVGIDDQCLAADLAREAEEDDDGSRCSEAQC